MFEKLFMPIQINKLEIKNRIAMAPMYAAGLTEPGGITAHTGQPAYTDMDECLAREFIEPPKELW